MTSVRTTWLRPRWLFSRRTVKALLWAVAIVAIAIGANIVGIYFVGSVAGWEHWLAAAAGYFLLWRLCLYAATAYGWVWMRRRLLEREPDKEAQRQARHRLLRSEIAGIIAIVALEASQWMQG
ncbi:hypothetical protein [Alcaligenes aquatilis]|uniref:Uncharacterized protein n=1 Tax=Alcaligenes aquatilis TaxID=323284 RepID=A0A3G2HR55_9BURK|nr:hypothetical protein [Alcaligenes aquatilis]AYN19544.1 hypothetical protein D3M96_02735 [Alcaligenes aquatilis]